MSFQRLPLPVGSAHPVRVSPPVRVRPARNWGSPGLLLIGLTAATAGAALGGTTPPLRVSLDAAGYTVAGATLRPQSGGVYAGPSGAVVISGRRAAASTTLNGLHMTGVCEMAADERSERCWFEVGGSRVSSTDVLRSGGWDRRYQGGGRARIELGGGRPIPVPVALGR